MLRYSASAGCTARGTASTAAVGGRQAGHREGRWLAVRRMVHRLMLRRYFVVYPGVQAGVLAVALILARSPLPASVSTQICMLPQVVALPLHMMGLKTGSLEAIVMSGKSCREASGWGWVRGRQSKVEPAGTRCTGGCVDGPARSSSHQTSLRCSRSKFCWNLPRQWWSMHTP